MLSMKTRKVTIFLSSTETMNMILKNRNDFIYISNPKHIMCLLDIAMVSFLKHLRSDDDGEIAIPLQDREAAFQDKAAL